ncbi:TonB-dependent receptor [Pseudoxanthomonas helianthi]|uniref:TonB-dependent receptor n=1 Tax=Pseudoxanthomonas helianthi TaxID=1453541 RepID=A0A941AVU0_9GAMM|nr:TonB-dependent receptor [Pseudoxanthomonas helianthi]MBP3985307.1 TonB-dependent receptor [Pseudoxanthomonas helianthi]
MSRHEKAADLKGNRTILRKRALVAACSAALFASFAIQAQEAPVGQAAAATDAEKTDTQKPEEKKDVETLGTVKVTGIRHSIATSLETKNESNSIVEAISAEDIGKLPDVSIAESLARLPGLAAQRVNGRAQVIAIRGLAPDFAASLLNGREQVTTGDNRGVEFDQYPSELVNAVTVYKTPDAKLIGQGLSGTVDMQTVSPLSVGERKINLNVRGERNSFGELNDGVDANGYRVSASYIDQFADNTIGIALGFAHLDSPFQEKHYKAWWWGGSADWFPADGIPGKPPGADMLMGAEIWARSADQKRDGLMGVFEFKPNDEFHSILDLYYSRFDQKETMRGIMWSQDPWTGNGVTLSNPRTARSGNVDVVTGGTVNNLEPVVRNDYNHRKDDLFSAGWRNTWKFAETWSVMADLSYSTTKRKQSIAETYAGIETVDGEGTVTPVLDSAVFDTPLSSNDFAQFAFGNDYSDPQRVLLSDPASWGHDGRIEAPRLKDTIKAFRVELHHDLDFGPFVGWDVGVNLSQRDKEKTSTVYFANLKNGRTPVAVGGDVLVSPTGLGFAGIGGVLGYDVNAALAKYYDIQQNMSDGDYQKDFTVTEKVRTFYSKVDIDTDIGSSVRLRGNVGMQIVRTDQSSVGFNVNNIDNLAAVHAGKTYTDFLPSLNLVADFGEGRFIRFGAAKTLARGRIDDMRAASNASVAQTGASAGLWSGNGGNPRLKPWRAKAVDVSFEKYFGEASYVALALFYKNLDNYIRTQTVDYDFTGYTNPNPGGTPPVSNIGTFSTPVNDKGGYLRGVEFSTALDFGEWTPALDGFGALFNASYTESNINPSGGDTSQSEQTWLPGLSRDVANLTLYYEKHGFSARINERYRSSFRGEIYSLFFSRAYTTVLADKQTDLQLGYEFGEGSALSGMSILFQVNNLTNSPYRTVQDSQFAGGASQPLEYNEYGRQYLLGLTYKF